MPIVPITSLDDPRIADYRSLRDQELLQRADSANPAAHRGIFMAEGELVVRRLASSPFATRSLLLAESRIEPMRDLVEAIPPQVPVFVAPQRVVNEIIGFHMHRGVLAVGERGPGADLAILLTRRGPFVVLEDLCNHDNIGAIFRNCAALGGAGVTVLLSPRTADPLYRKSLRVSMGHALLVPWARLDRWPDALHEFRAAGIRVLAMTPAQARAMCAKSPPNSAPGPKRPYASHCSWAPKARASPPRRWRTPINSSASICRRGPQARWPIRSTSPWPRRSRCTPSLLHQNPLPEGVGRGRAIVRFLCDSA